MPDWRVNTASVAVSMSAARDWPDLQALALISIPVRSASSLQALGLI
jgi:hypothetical protein